MWLSVGHLMGLVAEAGGGVGSAPVGDGERAMNQKVWYWLSRGEHENKVDT